MKEAVIKTQAKNSSKTYSTRLVGIEGIVAAALLVILGYSLGVATKDEPFGYQGKIVTSVTMGLTFGYYLGLATKQRDHGGAESVFYTWFFGSFVALAGVWSGYEAIAATGGVAQLTGSPSFLNAMVLVLGTLFGALAIPSGFIESARIKYLKRAFSFFSESLSKGFLFGYVVTIVGGVQVGIPVSALVIGVTILADSGKLEWPSLNQESGADF